MTLFERQCKRFRSAVVPTALSSESGNFVASPLPAHAQYARGISDRTDSCNFCKSGLFQS